MKILTFKNWALNENRSRWDSLCSKLVQESFTKWIKDWKSGKSNSTYSISIDNGLVFDLECTIYFGKVKGFEVLGTTGADARDVDDDGDYQDPYIIIDFAVAKEWLPGYWQDIYMHLSDVMRHEVEHITQDGMAVGNYKAGKPIEDDSFTRKMILNGDLPKIMYLMLPKEVDANLQGLRFEAKKRKESLKDAIDRYFNIQELTQEERNQVLEVWRRRAEKIGGIPKF